MAGKHTPGPWVAATSFRGVYSQSPSPGPVQVCRVPDNYDWPEQWKANARLIAAAPDLLEACKTMADELLALRQYIAETYGQTRAAPCLGAESAEYQGRDAIARATQPLPPQSEE